MAADMTQTGVSRTFWRTGAWTQYLLAARTRYAVHSPWLYALLESLLQGPDAQQMALLRSYRNALLADQQHLEVQDLGAGPQNRALPVRRVQVGHLAATSASTLAQAAALHQLAAYLRPQQVLELGTNLGMGTVALSLGAPTAKVYTVEGSATLSAYAQGAVMHLLPRHPIVFEVNDFDTKLRQMNDASGLDLVYLDGNHRLEPTMRYVEALLPHMHVNGVFILDDIRWSAEMWAAWQQLKAKPLWEHTLDAGRWGLLHLGNPKHATHFCFRPDIFRLLWKNRNIF